VIQGTFGVIQGTCGVIQGTCGVIQGTCGVISSNTIACDTEGANTCRGHKIMRMMIDDDNKPVWPTWAASTYLASSVKKK
jgi:hypothetical protein